MTVRPATHQIRYPPEQVVHTDLEAGRTILEGRAVGNAWKVLWRENNKKYTKTFEGERPGESGAVEFGKGLQARGILEVHIISKRKAFNKPPKVVVPPGLLWCPYCLKPRGFLELSIKARDGSVKSPRLWRCSICLISIHDAAVRSNNWVMTQKLDPRTQIKRPKLPTEKTLRLLASTGRTRR